jgi:hypothetical protein
MAVSSHSLSEESKSYSFWVLNSFLKFKSTEPLLLGESRWSTLIPKFIWRFFSNHDKSRVGDNRATSQSILFEQSSPLSWNRSLDLGSSKRTRHQSPFEMFQDKIMFRYKLFAMGQAICFESATCYIISDMSRKVLLRNISTVGSKITCSWNRNAGAEITRVRITCPSLILVLR